MRIAAVALLMILCSSVGQAEPDINFRAGFGEQLVTSCRAIGEVTNSVGRSTPTTDLLEDFHKAGTCMGFIQGVIDSDTIAHTDKNGHPVGRLCVPAEASERQLAKIVVKYGDDHPQQLHFPAAVIVLLAMKEAFPCQ
ncbi:MAG: Rap1a/Tai family immunity protein [Candidatus Sulfotelmatobacter sp.]